MALESIQIPITGLFWAMCAMLGFYLLFTDNVKEFDKTNFKGVIDSIQDLFLQFFDALLSKLNFFNAPTVVAGTPTPPRNIAKGIVVLLLFVSMAYISGLFSKTMADAWMNQGSKNHLNMKFLWASRDNTTDTYYKNTGDDVMLSVFNDSYKNMVCDRAGLANIRDIYNFSRYGMHAENGWKERYGEIRQDIISAATFALSFFTLMALTLLNFIIYTTRLIHSTFKSYRWLALSLIGSLILGFFFVLWQEHNFKSFEFTTSLLAAFINPITFILTVLTAIWMFALTGFVVLILTTSISNYRLFVPVFLLAFSITGYAISGRAWVYNHAIRDQYVFNSYKVRYDGKDGLRKLLKAKLHVQEYCEHSNDKVLEKWFVTIDTAADTLNNRLPAAKDSVLLKKGKAQNANNSKPSGLKEIVSVVSELSADYTLKK